LPRVVKRWSGPTRARCASCSSCRRKRSRSKASSEAWKFASSKPCELDARSILKAYLLYADANDTLIAGYVGSSNLSHSALHKGIEWRVERSCTGLCRERRELAAELRRPVPASLRHPAQRRVDSPIRIVEAPHDYRRGSDTLRIRADADKVYALHGAVERSRSASVTLGG
jgi:hypothetical protein